MDILVNILWILSGFLVDILVDIFGIKVHT